MRKKITVSVAEDRCFFHVFGDSYKYFDLQYLQINHPDLRDYCEKNKLELQREFLKQKELMENSDWGGRWISQWRNRILVTR